MQIEEQGVDPQEEISLKEQLFQYLRYWPWFILTVVIALIVAFLYLRYTTSSYRTEATILIKDSKNSELSDLINFEELGFGGGGLSKSDFENEIEILKSKRLTRQVVEELDLNIKYSLVGNIKVSELFDERPLSLKLLKNKDTAGQSQKFSISVKLIDENTFRVFEGNDEKGSIYNYGDRVDLEDAIITIVPRVSQLKKSLKAKDDLTIGIAVTSVENAVLALGSAIQVEPINKNSSVISLGMISEVKDKAEAILNNLVLVYNSDAILDRNLVSKNTADFIDQRLALISQELDSVERDKVSFKETNRLTDLQTEGELILQSAKEFNNRQLEIETKKEILDMIIGSLNEKGNIELLPGNLGIDQEGISNLVENYNELVLERNRLLTSAYPSNPTVKNLTNQIQELRGNVLQSLNSVRSTLRISEKDINTQRGVISGKISSIPGIERLSRDIERQQGIKEALYLYLLQKREETAISLAVTTPKAKIVDSAYSTSGAVSPKPRIIYLGALVAGLLLPFLIIYTKNLLDTKIHNRSDLESKFPSIPILGEIPELENKERETIKINDRSVLAESFRILRTNLSYLLKKQKTLGGVGELIYVTSTIKGEGKTFVAFNLALSLSSTNKSVLLVGADIRNPQLHRYIDKPEGNKGLSEYLFDDKLTVASITNEVDINRHKVDLILSGRIPPNPAELLMSDRYEELLEEVTKAYDYVIVDTAPTMLVTDTLLISQHADLTVYVSRAEFTDKKLLNYPDELYRANRLKNMAFVVNGVTYSNFGYGTKYGYGYGVEQDSWWKALGKKMRGKI